MSDEKEKDLTGLHDLPFASEESSETGPLVGSAPSGESQSIESFEELSDLPQTSELAEQSPSDAASSEATQAPIEDFARIDEVPIEPSTVDALTDQVAQVIPGKSAVPASFPFSLLIEGPLAEDERARLVDILTRENMGIREVDLEPQFAAGRVLIPRIGEYAGILLVQALRATRAQLKLGPSDTIFATDATRTEHDEIFTLADNKRLRTEAAETLPAERIPLTSEPVLASIPRFELIDTLTASASLRTTAIEAQKSSEFQDALEALQAELKQKAYIRGATAVVAFQIQLIPLGDPSRYRLVVLGSAIRPQSGSENSKNAARQNEIPTV